MKDYIVRATAGDGQIRAFAATTGNLVDVYKRQGMSYADKVFIEMCRDIIDNGTSTEGEKVRPRWEDLSLIHI